MADGPREGQNGRVAAPRKEDHAKRERLSVTVENGIKGRLRALQAETGLDMSILVERALKRILPVFEKDHGEILRKPE